MMGYWLDMSGYGIGHWSVFIVMVVAFVYPIGRILRRIGWSPFWSIVALIPLVNLVGLWIVAFADWPDTNAASSAEGGVRL